MNCDPWSLVISVGMPNWHSGMNVDIRHPLPPLRENPSLKTTKKDVFVAFFLGSIL
jgi:hypothetical protein